MFTQIKAPSLKKGDTIGIIAPAYAITPERLEAPINQLKLLGFNVKTARNLYSNTWGFAASDVERAEDFNEMASDASVQAVLFGGGEVCNEILPLIDYDTVRKNPKIYLSYSDSTTILNAITSLTGLITYYGQSPRTFSSLSDYNRTAFESIIMNSTEIHQNIGSWRVIKSGQAAGTLTGGYLVNYAVMIGGKYFSIDKSQKHILFLEDHESFSGISVVSKCLSHIAQSGIMDSVSGLLFGHYSNNPEKTNELCNVLSRFAERYNIPCALCNDFGHGSGNSVIPIGLMAELDTAKESLRYCDSTTRVI